MPMGFPAPVDEDSEDVAWALTTGAALWKRGERYDAIVWLKRAVDEASRAGAATRADELNRAATDLIRVLAMPGSRGESTPTPAPARVHRPPIPAHRVKPPTPQTTSVAPSEPRSPLAPARNEMPSVVTSAPPLAALTQRAASAPARPESRPPPPTIVPQVAVAKIPSIPPAGAALRSEPAPEMPARGTRLAELLDAIGALTPEQRAGLLRTAQLEQLADEEELKVNGLVMVLEGRASVGAAITDVAAAPLPVGEPLIAQSSITDALAMRLIAEVDRTTVATWDRGTAEHYLALTPELLDQWRQTSDRLQAMSGSTIGAVGERLDENLRAMLFERLEVRPIEAGVVLVQAGRPVPGIVIVGVGHLELERDGAAIGKVGPGEFLFGGEVLAQSPAPANARAGARGAVVLIGSRSTTYELLMSCPPLLEIFAGM